MAKIDRYREYVKQVIRDHASHQLAYGEIEVQTIFDPAGDHYQLVHAGWHKKLRQLVTVRWEAVKLTPTEYALLRLMIQHAGRVLTQRQILKEIWGPAYVEEPHYLRVYFAQLRQKLEENPALPQLLITEPGVGYRLVVQS